MNDDVFLKVVHHKQTDAGHVIVAIVIADGRAIYRNRVLLDLYRSRRRFVEEFLETASALTLTSFSAESIRDIRQWFEQQLLHIADCLDKGVDPNAPSTVVAPRSIDGDEPAGWANMNAAGSC